MYVMDDYRDYCTLRILLGPCEIVHLAIVILQSGLISISEHQPSVCILSPGQDVNTINDLGWHGKLGGI